jgi:transcriptional regulator with XRE-family HTH domain
MSKKIQENITNIRGFAVRFRNLRESLKLSQRDLAKILGFSANTQISKFENAESEPTLETLRKLARLSRRTDIRIDLHELITGNPSHVVEDWKEENQTLLELIAKYISSQVAHLLDQRDALVGELGVAEENLNQESEAQKEHIVFLKTTITQIQNKLIEAAEDQHYVKEALDGITKRQVNKTKIVP